MNFVQPPLVVHIIYRLAIGGLENGLVNLINCMPPERYRHAIVCLAGYSDFRLRIQRTDVEVISIDKQPGKDPGAYWRLWCVLRRLRPAIVHTRNLGTVDLQWIAFLAGVRARIHGEHGWDSSDPNGSNSKNLKIRRLCSPVIQRYVAVSRDIETWLQQQVGISGSRVRQIYNGVDEKRFAPSGSLAADFPWAEDCLVIGTVGRLDAIKNQLQLVRALRILISTNPISAKRLRLVIVGDGPLFDALSAEISKLGLNEIVWMPRARDDVPDVMRNMDIFALPSVNEGISNTLLEAMAVGLPVVAASVGGNVELVANGVTGSLYETNTAEVLANALQPYVHDPELRIRRGESGRDRVQRQFGLQSMVANYVSLYDELLCAA
jgi:sugar transferase (PEP-CTERM/EpsH1 system associated)